MNKVIFTTCLLCLSTYSYSAEKLPTIKVQGNQLEQNDPQHLTTRIQWLKFPQVKYQSNELKDQERSAIIRVKADHSGKVLDAEIQESTGIRQLDQKIIDAVEVAKVKPAIKNGKSVAMVGYQTFTLTMNNATDHKPSAQCTYTFHSNHWNKQENGKSVAFRYTKQPQLALDESLLKFKNRVVKFKFKVNKQGDVTQAKLTKLSGVNALDQQVLTAVENAKIEVKRSYRTLWTYKPSTFSDEIHFKTNDCQ